MKLVLQGEGIYDETHSLNQWRKTNMTDCSTSSQIIKWSDRLKAKNNLTRGYLGSETILCCEDIRQILCW